MVHAVMRCDANMAENRSRQSPVAHEPIVIDDAKGASSNELLPTHRRLALLCPAPLSHTAVADDAGPLPQSESKCVHLQIASALFIRPAL
jgi:hypothetical protein